MAVKKHLRRVAIVYLCDMCLLRDILFGCGFHYIAGRLLGFLSTHSRSILATFRVTLSLQPFHHFHLQKRARKTTLCQHLLKQLLRVLRGVRCARCMVCGVHHVCGVMWCVYCVRCCVVALPQLPNLKKVKEFLLPLLLPKKYFWHLNAASG